jgi:hypothetical protein
MQTHANNIIPAYSYVHTSVHTDNYIHHDTFSFGFVRMHLHRETKSIYLFLFKLLNFQCLHTLMGTFLYPRLQYMYVNCKNILALARSPTRKCTHVCAYVPQCDYTIHGSSSVCTKMMTSSLPAWATSLHNISPQNILAVGSRNHDAVFGDICVVFPQPMLTHQCSCNWVPE